MKTIRRIKEPKFNVDREKYEGEEIHIKIRRILDENEPITDGAPLIYTPKADGVRPEYNIRTDRWEIAMDAIGKLNEYKVSEYLKEGTPQQASEDNNNNNNQNVENNENK